MSVGFRMKWWGRKANDGHGKIELRSCFDNRPSPNPKTEEETKGWVGDQFVLYWGVNISARTIAKLTTKIDVYFGENSVRSPICHDGSRWKFVPDWSNHIYLDPGSDYYDSAAASECEFAFAGLEEYSPGDPAGYWQVRFLHEMNEADTKIELKEHSEYLAKKSREVDEG